MHSNTWKRRKQTNVQTDAHVIHSANTYKTSKQCNNNGPFHKKWELKFDIDYGLVNVPSLDLRSINMCLSPKLWNIPNAYQRNILHIKCSLKLVVNKLNCSSTVKSSSITSSVTVWRLFYRDSRKLNSYSEEV